MVPAEPAPKATSAVATKERIERRNISKAKRGKALRPKTQGAGGNSRLQLAPPLTKKARRIIINNTEKLMHKRNELDTAILIEASRPLETLKTTDWLPREHILRLCERLALRERRYFRCITKALEERTRLCKRDPSTERAVDLDLIRELLWKFRRHLGPYLLVAEKQNIYEYDDGTSSSDSDSSGDKAGAEVASGPSSDDDEKASNDGSLDKETSNTQKPSATGGLDGAFDDTIAPKKRKANEPIGSGKELQKKAKKEQTANDRQLSVTISQTDKTTTCQKPQRKEDSVTAINPEIDSMSQTKTSRHDGDTKGKVDRKTKEPATVKAPSDSGIPIPFYKLHAKAMMQPDFNDHVHLKPPHRRRTKRPTREYKVSGALLSPHLPSPKPGLQSDKASSRNSRL
ncbi:hypothetical protein VM1G_02783 [Cytospora mali]|uniref:Uncharacterized protein n=1 Tax=Cytospora mali TaxID=578113 RepID=A0A194VUT3_CYTMA|nr:hypothetical protein VM1G_02783 [Valsa mali]